MAEATVEETIHECKGSSSSDSESEKTRSPVFKKKRLFGKEEPVHTVLGEGKSAEIILWRNKQMSASILAGVTVLWLLFECVGYHFLTFICHSLIFLLVVLFLWSNAASFVNRFVASGKDLKTFLMVITGLWVLSVIGSWFSFLTLFYIAVNYLGPSYAYWLWNTLAMRFGQKNDDAASVFREADALFVLLYSLPALYEKYEDQVDTAAEKVMIEMNKQYAVLDKKLLCKIPRCPFSDNKQQ